MKRKRNQITKCYLKYREPFWKANNYLFFKIIIALFSLLPLFCVLYYYKNPLKILDFKFEYFCIAAGGIIAVFGIIQMLVCKLIGHSNFINAGSIICMITTGTLLVFFIYSMITVGGRMGTVSIHTNDELNYIENYRYGNFKIENDIDVGDASDICFSSFKGAIDGQGHIIKNISLESQSLFKNNDGTINNLRFETINAKHPLFVENSGTVTNVYENSKLLLENKEIVQETLEEEKEELDPSKKQVLVLGAIFVVGSAILIGFCFLIGEKGNDTHEIIIDIDDYDPY